jgi:transcriptional regulator with XRE-family HTH domain
MVETLGARLGRLRLAQSLTQQELADRIAVSRVAISHFEMDLAVPSERTIALLAGVFKQDPLALVSGTYYPPGKAERLPPVVARYTEIEKELCLLERDLDWLRRLRDERLTFDTCHDWLTRLDELTDGPTDKREDRLLNAARAQVRAILHSRSLSVGEHKH